MYKSQRKISLGKIVPLVKTNTKANQANDNAKLRISEVDDLSLPGNKPIHPDSVFG